MRADYKKIPATLGLIAINVIVFAFTRLEAGSLNDSHWTLSLLRHGALFNPLTLGNEWYRIFTHMFLHGGILHLAVNMYALYSVGSDIEILAGTKKFTIVYFVSGIASALNSLYWSLFTIGVGASGAIFGLFGFSLMINIFLSRRSGKSMTPVLVNFAVFVGINLLIAKSVNADNAAHLGGLAAGMLIGLYALVKGEGAAFVRTRIEYFMMPALAIIYLTLPRYQVHYYRFFQSVLAAEDSTRQRLKKDLSDPQYLKVFAANTSQWDSARVMLDRQSDLPTELSADTFRLRRYIGLRIAENGYKTKIIERESYIYLDSIEEVNRQIPQFMSLDFPLSFRIDGEEKPPPRDTSSRELIKVYYDRDWVEIPSPPAAYYRIGYRDSLGRWNGEVRDFYANGDVQMKGTYKNNKREGVFLYYSDHHTYTSAGRYRNDRSIGKWETFHTNGRLASEVFYNGTYFLKNSWDSLGNQLVVDGSGKETQTYPNGVIRLEGAYRNGRQEGYWYGRHENGDMYFQESYSEGRLISGKSRNARGQTFVYDASSLFPLPEKGLAAFQAYLKKETDKVDTQRPAHVRVSFRVTKRGMLTDFNIEESTSPALNAKAIAMLLHGPSWLPAKMHGDQPVDAFTFVDVVFN